MLALVPYVLAHPCVTIAELAERFEVSEQELERELELLPMCGLPPYTADRLIDVAIVDGGVDHPTRRVLRATAAIDPGRGLRAAGRRTRAARGAGLRSRRTARSRARQARGHARQVAGSSRSTSVTVATTSQALTDAAADREQVEIDYYSFARDEMTTRVVDPWRVFHAFGAWYLAAWCHRAERRAAVPGRPRPGRPAAGQHFEPPTARRTTTSPISSTRPSPTTHG